jgi:hypothetical protein
MLFTALAVVIGVVLATRKKQAPLPAYGYAGHAYGPSHSSQSPYPPQYQPHPSYPPQSQSPYSQPPSRPLPFGGHWPPRR